MWEHSVFLDTFVNSLITKDGIKDKDLTFVFKHGVILGVDIRTFEEYIYENNNSSRNL